MAHPLLKLYAGRDNHVRFDAFGIERLFIGRTLARKPETQGGKLAQLHTETVVEIARKTVYEVGQHVFHIATRERRPTGDVERNLVQRLATCIHGVGIHFLLCSVLRVCPLNQFNFHDV